ncbi:MAG: EAL domain-containing protein [Sedimentitalea sp.]
MQKTQNRKRIDLPVGAESPLATAVRGRDQGTVDMVRDALKFNHTMLAFQPIMQARPPHDAAFFEGLIRVLDATGRVIPAKDFIGQVENSELGRELDCASLETGLRTLSQNEHLRLAINMSARSIGYKRWMRILDRFLKRDSTLAERLVLEINEGSAMTVPEVVADFMSEMQSKGICFTLDDFGSSSISVRHFRDLYFDAVKLHGSFVRGVHANPDNKAVVESLVMMARRFEMLTIAASVEDKRDAQYLVSIGVDCLQGYLFGAPTVRPPWVTPESSQKTA